MRVLIPSYTRKKIKKKIRHIISHKRLLGPNGNLWMKKTNQEALSLKWYVVVDACSGEQVNRDLCCNPEKMTGNPVWKRNPNWVVIFWFQTSGCEVVPLLWNHNVTWWMKSALVTGREIDAPLPTLQRTCADILCSAALNSVGLLSFNKSLTVLRFQKFKVDFPKAGNSVELRAFSSQAGSWRPFHLINRHLVPLMTTCIVEAGSVASCTQGQTKLYQFTSIYFVSFHHQTKSVGECHLEADSGQHHTSQREVIETYSAPFPTWCEFQ